MSEETKKQSNIVTVCGLWPSKFEEGGLYGTAEDGFTYSIRKNKFKKEDKHPEYVLTKQPSTKRGAATNGPSKYKTADEAFASKEVARVKKGLAERGMLDEEF